MLQKKVFPVTVDESETAEIPHNLGTYDVLIGLRTADEPIEYADAGFEALHENSLILTAEPGVYVVTVIG